MDKHSRLSSQRRERRRPERAHPVWQGIGCLMILIIPVMAYAGAVLLVQANREQGWLALPPELARTVSLPVVGPVQALYGTLMAAVLLAVIGYGILVILYSALYRSLSPQDPFDAPPIRKEDRRRR